MTADSTPTVKVDIEELEALARASDETWDALRGKGGYDCWWTESELNRMLDGNEADCDFISALSPTVVLALIAEVRASRAGATHVGSCAGCFFAEAELLDALRDGAEAGEPAEKLLKRVLRDAHRQRHPHQGASRDREG